MLKIVKKTPTIKQFAYFYMITKWQKKKKLKLKSYCPLFGNVIIHKTGTRLTTKGVTTGE